MIYINKLNKLFSYSLELSAQKRNLMNNLSISKKLVLLLFLPILGLIIMAVTISLDRYHTYTQYNLLNHSVILSNKMTTLVHELQKERGMTAGFLGSKGVKFKDALPQQRLLTDDRHKDFLNYLNSINTQNFGEDYQTLINSVLHQLDGLQDKRTQISGLKITGKNAISYYTTMNNTFLEIVRKASSFSPNATMAQQLNAYTNFLLAKERAGIERAIGAVTFAGDKFLPGMRLKFNKLIAEQHAYLHSFTKLANQTTLNFYKNTVQGEAVKEVERMREVALTNTTNSNFNIDSAYWFKTITLKINLLKKVDDTLAHNLISQSNSLSQSAKNEMIIYIVISLFIILISLFLGIKISKNISLGVTKLSVGIDDFFKFLNKEHNDATLIDLNRQDEIGIMVNSINENISRTKEIIIDDIKFMEAITQIVEKIKEGYLYQRLDYNAKSENLQELKISINEMLEVMNTTIGGSINKITDVLNSYANLDFTNNIKDAKGHVETHILNVGEMITTMLIENKQNGLTIDHSAQILLENVDVLNVSSNAAAASLEETAAALEEITGSIRHNTENILQMSGLAKEVTQSVNEGQVMANETTTAMENINTQVSAISEAILVIDQIAFQTNILSLNAAVEAATAGEAGKGFAVVAGEVRNLANRSAQAANEIKALVESATTKADDGKNIADRMIAGYTQLNDNVSKTIELIEDVTNASKEQQEGIEQINDAVASLDQQTQKNAAVANQTKEIAVSTRTIAKQVVDSANEKEFLGKESVEGKTIEVPKFAEEINSMPLQPRASSNSKTAISSQNDDSWESF